ncbi:MAG: ABC transporter substrate-binding protein [Treponema sp.]|nr:ABC transporter substrate-binding protein [Treponema sp.]
MINHTKQVTVLLLVLFCLSSCMPRSSSAQDEVPQRIVSLIPAVTEILFAIGAGEKVVGVTEYCDYPPIVKSITSVGGFAGATMSMEQIWALRPDLVFISRDMHGRILSLLDELNIKSYEVEPRNFNEVYDTILAIGDLTGCLTGAKEIVGEMQAKIALVGERVGNRERPSVFWLLSDNPLMSAGSGTFITEAISLGGGRNIFSDVQESWPLVSPEQVLLRSPDWVLIGDDMSDIRQFINSPLWQTIPAVRNGRVEIINADILYRYGPRLADAVYNLAEIFHGRD